MNMIKYVIKQGPYYFSNHISRLQWTDCLEEAKQFNSMIGAEGYAVMELGLNLEEYAVKQVLVGVYAKS